MTRFIKILLWKLFLAEDWYMARTIRDELHLVYWTGFKWEGLDRNSEQHTDSLKLFVRKFQ